MQFYCYWFGRKALPVISITVKFRFGYYSNRFHCSLPCPILKLVTVEVNHKCSRNEVIWIPLITRQPARNPSRVFFFNESSRRKFMQRIRAQREATGGANGMNREY